ncbi:MAG: DUF1254 domain-containing protein [Okeania sp. SIO2B3]|nr:DUF1254 domain-containing protein [Okeania sp. SIO2B3]
MAQTSSDDIAEIATQAYIYAYPLVLLEKTRQATTNVTQPIDTCAPMNQFAHLREFPNASFKQVARPNVDTLYSSAFFDLSDGPLVLSVPDTDRYYLLPILDMWTDVVAVPGTRTTGESAGKFVLVGPDWDGALPQDLTPIIPVTTNLGWIVGRTQTNGSDDYEHVWEIQDGYQLTPLSQWATGAVPPIDVLPEGTCDSSIKPSEQVAAMDADTFFSLFAELLKQNSPHLIDWSMVEQLEKIGVVVGESFDFNALDSDTQAALTAAVSEGLDLVVSKSLVGDQVNNWVVGREFRGTYGAAYWQRANVAFRGVGANPPEDSIYTDTVSDVNGERYEGGNNYVLHFDADQLPPVSAFWSVTLYDPDGYFVGKGDPGERYAVGDRDDLTFNDDGSLDIYIQSESPGQSLESNWLPAPATGGFDLMMRLYWPNLDILTGQWNPPAVFKEES